MSVKEWELEELAGFALGRSEREVDEMIEAGDVDSELEEKWGISFEQFQAVALALLPLTPVLPSELTGKMHHTFLREAENGKCCIAIVKKEFGT